LRRRPVAEAPSIQGASEFLIPRLPHFMVPRCADRRYAAQNTDAEIQNTCSAPKADRRYLIEKAGIESAATAVANGE
jgi:hypothetical protein